MEKNKPKAKSKGSPALLVLLGLAVLLLLTLNLQFGLGGGWGLGTGQEGEGEIAANHNNAGTTAVLSARPGDYCLFVITDFDQIYVRQQTQDPGNLAIAELKKICEKIPWQTEDQLWEKVDEILEIAIRKNWDVILVIDPGKIRQDYEQKIKAKEDKYHEKTQKNDPKGKWFDKREKK